jgi:hypothetical protein
MTTTQVDLTADTIDVRDIIARVEELESARDDFTAPNRDGYQTHIGADEIWTAANPDDAAELAALRAILDQLKGYGGDEEWRGDWYPVTLISERTFEDHARELLEECGTIPRDLPWYVAIDWETTAQHIQGDYTSVEIDGTTYWYR